MKFLHGVFVLFLISTLVLESEAWRRRRLSYCPSPPEPTNTNRNNCAYPYTDGETCNYSCRAGYNPLRGNFDRTCSGGVWSGTNLICINFSPISQWPAGTYGLPKTNTGCPEEAGVTWSEGYRYQDTEDDDANNHWSSGLHFDGGYWRNNMYQKFCMKTNSSEGNGSWPPGNYCIFKKGDCPSDQFESGEVLWDDENSNNKDNMTGQLPDGVYDKDTKIEYCCRNDGWAQADISLPFDKPFYLFRFGAGCQNVAWMKVREEYFYWDDQDDNNQDFETGACPYDDGGVSNHKLHYCYYYT